MEKKLINAELIIKKKLYDDKDSFARGYKVYACYVPNEYSHLFPDSEIIISGVCPSFTETCPYKFSLTEITQGKYAGGYKIEDYVYNIASISLEEVLEGLEYSTSTILKIKNVYPTLLDDIRNNKKVSLDKVDGVIPTRTFINIVEKIKEHFQAIILKNESKKINLTLTIAQSNNILKAYPDINIFFDLFKSNPYKTLYSINGFGFKTSDEIILKMKPEFEVSKERCLAAMGFCLEQNEKKGSTFMQISKCFEDLQNIIPSCSKFFKEVITDEINSKDPLLFIDTKNNRIALMKTFQTEKYLADTINSAAKTKKNYNFIIDENIKKTVDGNPLSEEQLLILETVQKESICVLTGFAGAGKSSSMYALVKMLKRNNKSVMLLAPTGRASKVLSNAVGHTASTIHRMLLLNERVKELDADFIICDEATMIDIHLMQSLLEKINFLRTSLIFICDPSQLASVNCGNCLSDIIKSGKVKVVSLTTIFRYKEGGLSYVATSVREGTSYVFNEKNEIKGEYIKGQNYLANKFGNYTFFNTDYIDDLLKLILIREKNKFNNLNHLTILTPSNKGSLGTIRINSIVQDFINPLSEENATPFSKNIQGINIGFRIGDKVIQIQNKYKVPLHGSKETAPIFNGEDGVILGYDEDLNILIIQFNDLVFDYPVKDLQNLNLGYCITIHKSQGSTFEDVILITAPEQSFMLSRNLLYVGVTRAKGRVAHLGTKQSLFLGLKKEETLLRETFLYNLLKK